MTFILIGLSHKLQSMNIKYLLILRKEGKRIKECL